LLHRQAAKIHHFVQNVRDNARKDGHNFTMARTEKQLAVILLNLGTPEAPTVPAIRRYLAEFLSGAAQIPKIFPDKMRVGKIPKLK